MSARWASGVRSESNSGLPVTHSGPGLSRARNPSDARSKPEGLSSSPQPKSGRGWRGQSPCRCLTQGLIGYKSKRPDGNRANESAHSRTQIGVCRDLRRKSTVWERCQRYGG